MVTTKSPERVVGTAVGKDIMQGAVFGHSGAFGGCGAPLIAAEFMATINGVQVAPRFLRCHYFMQLTLQVWFNQNSVQLLLLHSP